MINDDIIRLRALEPEDLECLYQWENDMDLWEVSCLLYTSDAPTTERV